MRNFFKPRLALALVLALLLSPAMGATQNKNEGNGETIATTASQKLSFHGAQPVAQRTSATEAQAGTAASLVLTFTAAPSAAETVTVGTMVYTFKTSLTGAANEVLIGTEAASISNLAAAINGTITGPAVQGPGVTYGLGTVAQTALVTATFNGTTMTVTAVKAGTAGNSIAVAETSASASWTAGGTVLASGADGSVAQLTVLVNELRAALVEKGLIKGS